ncbi:hypothetical protein [Sporomusa silvacetica]|uniref:hypothetical protein n=1 Tax=Sporomusa silvacetica TaxID=55504 RepID=UPI001FECD435|nr:hypothetical protein [Sporomusa silvacetica]
MAAGREIFLGFAGRNQYAEKMETALATPGQSDAASGGGGAAGIIRVQPGPSQPHRRHSDERQCDHRIQRFDHDNKPDDK